MTSFTVLFDANVLYPAPLRDLLIELSTAGLFRAKWSNTIHDEWTSSLLAKRPDLKSQDLAKTRSAMNAAVLDCLVENYESLIPSLNLPDQNDRHVLAAAIQGRADTIVTMNQKDFPKLNYQNTRYKANILMTSFPILSVSHPKWSLEQSAKFEVA